MAAAESMLPIKAIILTDADKLNLQQNLIN